MLSLHPDGELNAVAEKMTKALENVRTGEITTATRSVEIDGVKVETGQVIALLDGKLVASASSVEEGCLQLLEKVKASEHELITLFYGQDMPHADANRIADAIRNKYPAQEVEVQEGGQPHYQFIISVE
jgi:dihydroxyacetone kinase-like predicted kinase